MGQPIEASKISIAQSDVLLPGDIKLTIDLSSLARYHILFLYYIFVL